MTLKSYLLVLLFFCLILPLAKAETREISCKVVRISDGDTLHCSDETKTFKVRLQYIDAPESAQPFGKEAKNQLSKWVFKQQVKLVVSGYDRYKRMLAVVFNDKKENINLKLVQVGLAWAYQHTQTDYSDAQRKAREKKIGLWQDAHPINPADWRREKHRGVYQQTPQLNSSHFMQDFYCSAQKLWREIDTLLSLESDFRQHKKLAQNKRNIEGIGCGIEYLSK